MKKILSMVLAIVIMIGIVPLGAVTLTASAERWGGYYTYVVENNEVTITNVDDAIYGDVIVPSQINGYPVTSIKDHAFYNCNSLTSVTIPDSVTNMGEWVFYNCKNLKKAVIPGSVVCIDEYTFYNCYALENIVIGDGVTRIGARAFLDCESLVSVVIPASVKSMGYNVFDDCHALETVVICDGVTEIGDGAFLRCKSLKNVLIPDSVINIGCDAFSSCESLESVTFSSNSGVGLDAFYNCEKLRTVFFRGSDEEMIKYVMDAENSGLTKVTWYANSCFGASNHTYDHNCDAECNVCGDARDIIGHRYDEYTKKPTCTTDGYTQYYCVGCGDTYTIDLPAINHAYDDEFDVVCNNCEEERLCVSGDANSDGKINGRDYAIILQYLNGWNVKIDVAATDVNDDHKINGQDCSILMQYLCRKNVELK